MKTRRVVIAFIIGLGLLALLRGVAPATSHAQAPPSNLPDLAIKGIRLNLNCQVVVVVTNLGPGRVPDAVWTTHTPASSSVYLTINGRGWGGATIWQFDPGKRLQPPGGVAEYVSSYVVRGRAEVMATVDHTAQVREANEANNSWTSKLVCPTGQPTPGGTTAPQPPGPGAGRLPDLVPILSTPPSGTVGAKNIGGAAAGPSKLVLRCNKVGYPGPGGGCPEIPAADLAAYSDPAFPDRVVVNIPALAPGESYTQRLRFWDLLCWPNGKYQLAATADAGHVVAESNEANNQSESVLTSQRQCPAGGQKPAS